MREMWTVLISNISHEINKIKVGTGCMQTIILIALCLHSYYLNCAIILTVRLSTLCDQENKSMLLF